MFTPIKNSLQTAVDKRFKQTSDPTDKLEEFGEHIESVVQVFDVHSIARQLLDEAIAAFDASGGAVYLRRGVARLASTPHEHVNSYPPGGPPRSPTGRWSQQSGWNRRPRQQPHGQDRGRYRQTAGREQTAHEYGREDQPPKPYRPRGIFADLELVYKSEYWNGNTVIGVPLRFNGKRYGLLALGQRSNGQVYTPEDRERLKRVVDSVTDALVLEEGPRT
jgi:hypothetical protein